MKKIAFLIAVTALTASAITLAGYQFLLQRTETVYVHENSPLHFTNDISGALPAAAVPDFVQAAAAVSPAVVHLKTSYAASGNSAGRFGELFGTPSGQVAMASGSGVLISADGYIVTNNHVVENSSGIEVILPDRRSFSGKVVGTDPSTDLALVKIEGTNFPTIPLGNSDAVQIGEWVLAVGYPFSLNSTVTAGIVSAKGRSIGILDQTGRTDPQTPGTAIESYIQTDAAINPGNSGGALVNGSGQLIGINAAIASQTGSYAGYGFAIPVNLAKKIITDIRQYGEVKRGFIGVSFPAPSVEDQLLKQKGIDPGTINGVYITEVQPGSAAASAGLQAGDIIKSVDGSPVLSSAEFSERIARHHPGDRLSLSYLRNGGTNNVSVTLKEREPIATPASSSATGTSLQQKLGATFSVIDPAVKQRYGLRSGIQITGISGGSFFDRARIPRGTVITRINGRPVNTIEELNRLLASSRNGMVNIEGITPDGTSFAFNFPLGA